ncbi:MAG: hypothetical protein A2X25_15355 [Chloroflexi bacterium GWB2_49_20]|nr:MAG: hypothetical protein A2X25_15355 [Chloroflexi bacterium GWB2_49_20]OGN77445.1 MAG: hypothetical protein A2X26_13585 [Chloroflexi bacterium GWC2_49_37]OGN84851.1 MAG: hypothetical protein A2X27_14865 [Chloroflexi bacterium GWD2_49_16]HCC79223.1 hypothetical protein [Anaerolineae bacterium]
MPKKSGAGKANKGSSSMKSRSHKSGRGKTSKFGGGFRLKERGKSIAGGVKSKSGCLSKLFMLTLPFIAVGALLFLMF